MVALGAWTVRRAFRKKYAETEEEKEPYHEGPLKMGLGVWGEFPEYPISGYVRVGSY